MVTRENIETALAMAIDDEAVDDNDVKQYEVFAIKRRVSSLLDTLANDASVEDEDDDDDGLEKELDEECKTLNKDDKEE